MGMQIRKRGLTALAAVVGVAMMGAPSVLADTTFDSKYQANGSEEASLLQTAQSSNVTSPTIMALSNTVQTINNQVTALYSIEQSLASAKSNIPSVDQDDLQKQLQELQQKRKDLLHQSEQAWKEVNKWFYRRHTKYVLQQLAQAMNKWKQIGVQVKAVNDKIADLKAEEQKWKDHPYDGGLAALQDSILKLQASAIHYTKEWIALEQSATTTSGSTSLAAPTVSVNTANGVSSVQVSGAQPNATITLYNSQGTVVNTATADQNGNATLLKSQVVV